jgi:hypothetical protein
LYNSPTHSSTVRWLVPLGIKAFFTETLKIAEDRVTEMDWWEEVLVELPLLSSSSSSPSSSSTELERGEAGEGKENSEAGRSGVRLRVACTPSQHGSGRGLGEKDHSLWCSWALGLEKGGARQRNSLTTAVKHPSSDPASPPAASKLHSLNAEEDSLHHERERDEAVLSHPVRAIRDQPEYFLATAAEIKATHPVWVREMDWKCFFAGFVAPLSSRFLSVGRFGMLRESELKFLPLSVMTFVPIGTPAIVSSVPIQRTKSLRVQHSNVRQLLLAPF